MPPPGVEPGHPCEYWILSPARLPIPPKGQRVDGFSNGPAVACPWKKTFLDNLDSIISRSYQRRLALFSTNGLVDKAFTFNWGLGGIWLATFVDSFLGVPP